jgi:putative inorganic carbon (HCO3(-)) transporter
MRGLVFFLAFVASLPLIFVSPFYGVIIWYVFSLGNFHTMVFGPFATLNYAYIIAILTCLSWVISRKEKVHLPVTLLVVLTLVFAFWITFTSWFALAPDEGVWTKWSTVEKILFMCLVGYALSTTRERVDQLIWAVVLTLGLWGVKGAISGILSGGGKIHGPDQGALSDNNDFGLGLILILPLLFYHWHFATNKYIRQGLLLMSFLVSMAVILTYSRGALIGVCAMGSVFWLRSRAKFVTGFLIVAIAASVYAFAPSAWFERMGTIESFDADGSAMSRIHLWKVSLRIAELHPFTGGGFRVTFNPIITNEMLRGTDLARLTRPRAVHSIYFDALSEHGWVGLVLFLMIGVYSWINCSWLIRNSRDRPELEWANLLGRMGHAVLVGYGTAGAFASQAYLDEYWCLIFVFDAARRVVAQKIGAPAAALSGDHALGLRPQTRYSTRGLKPSVR